MDLMSIIKMVIWLAIVGAIVLYATKFAGRAADKAGV